MCSSDLSGGRPRLSDIPPIVGLVAGPVLEADAEAASDEDVLDGRLT